MKREASPHILVVALSPDDKLIYEFDNNFEAGGVNRAQKVHRIAAGKGINAARAIRCLGEPVKVVGVAGGASGNRISEGLSKLGATPCLTQTSSQTRCCVTLIEANGTVTEIVENTGSLTEKELEAFKVGFKESLNHASVVLFAGSVPANVPTSIYAELLRIAHSIGKEIPVIIDAQNELLLESLPVKPTLVKPNRSELGKAFGILEPSDKDLVDLCKELLKKGAGSVFISAGSDKALYVSRDDVSWFFPPKVEAYNTVGCGDALAGALAVGFHRKLPIKEMLTLALAAASASAQTLYPSDLDPREVGRLQGLVTSASAERS